MPPSLTVVIYSGTAIGSQGLTGARFIASSERVKRLLLILPLLGLFAVPACAADPLYLEETDLVLTARDTGRDYSSFKTYVLIDELADLCLQPTSGPPSADAYGGAGGASSSDPANCFETDHSSDSAILEAIAENMEKMGYQRVSEDEVDSADALLLPALVSRGTFNLSLPYCYPDAFYRGCVQALSARPVHLVKDSILLQLIDLSASSGDELVTSWTAAIDQYWTIRAARGTAPGSDGSDAADEILSRAVDKAFEQSPYLGGKP